MLYSIVSVLFLLLAWFPCMTINKGGLLLDMIKLLAQMLLPSGNPFKCHEKVLYLQPIYDPT